jgi:3-hydroxyisobutyrate dehydrogenase
MTTIRAGFIGLGSQGAPIARRIVDAGIPLTIWARREASLEPFADTPATVAATPAEVAATSDVVGLCVLADDDVADVVLRKDGVLAGMAPGGVIAVHSTIHPDTCRRLAAAAEAHEVRLIDAPVSGGEKIAREGNLLVMVGGDPDALRVARPVFETFGNPIVHLGPLGSGEVAKIINNFVLTAQFAVALETYDFAEGLGLDKAALGEVLRHGSGRSEAASVVAGLGFDLTNLAAKGPLLYKDSGLALELARAAGTEETTDVLRALAQQTLDVLGFGDPPLEG